MFSSMSIILIKIDGFMRWRASGVSWEALEVAPEASWEDPRDLPERPWELLKGPRDGSGVFEEDIWRGPGRPFFSFWGGEFAHGIMKY